MNTSPVVEGWFTTGEAPALLGSRCTKCQAVFFPPLRTACGNPACGAEALVTAELSRTGTVWSYTDAQYQPPAPFVPEGDVHEPFAIAAVELAEGLVVLGQVAKGYGVTDLHVGCAVELVVERLHDDETGARLTWRWKPSTHVS